MELNLDKVRNDVADLLSFDKSGHGADHVFRVYDIALRLSEKESANTEIVALGALLHDTDDYKLFGEENAKNLTNAKRIMLESDIPQNTQEQVCDIIHNMGYSKSLAGIRPNTLEGKIVSDADMLDVIGVVGAIRTLHYHIINKNTAFFDKDIWPEINLTQSEYKDKKRESDNFINHFFEKILKLKNMIMTESGRVEAEKRHDITVLFLQNFFTEMNLPEWNEYLDNYLLELNK